MKRQFDFLRNYLFLRCFSEKEYLDSFASGKCIYMNSVEKFWEIENEFQGDSNECCVISPNGDTKWSCFVGNGKPEEKIADVADFRISISGFLYCMFTIPKTFFAVENGIVLHDKGNEIYQDFYKTLNWYSAEVGHTYICVFDAFVFMKRLSKYLGEKSMDFACGSISYKNIDEMEKIQYFIEKKIEKIVFSKPEKYKSQHEFRIFVPHELTEIDHLELAGVRMDDIIFLQAQYTPKLEGNTDAD